MADDISGHERLSQGTAVPVAVGGSLYSYLRFHECLERGACSIEQVDVARVGGITPRLKVAHVVDRGRPRHRLGLRGDHAGRRARIALQLALKDGPKWGLAANPPSAI